MIAYSSVAAESEPVHEDLIRENLDLVKKIAHHLSARLPATVELDDLYQAGMIGLLEAANNFDAAKGASFTTYAGIRIRGAMLDEVRKTDWTPRSVYRKHREVSNAIHEIEAEKGSAASGKEVAEKLGISVDDYHSILRDTAGSRLFSLDESQDEFSPGKEIPASRADLPDRILAKNQFFGELTAAIDKIPERERLVLSLYYEQELNLKEIGAVLDVSESRVCQIHGQALLRLRSMVAE